MCLIRHHCVGHYCLDLFPRKKVSHYLVRARAKLNAFKWPLSINTSLVVLLHHRLLRFGRINSFWIMSISQECPNFCVRLYMQYHNDQTWGFANWVYVATYNKNHYCGVEPNVLKCMEPYIQLNVIDIIAN